MTRLADAILAMRFAYARDESTDDYFRAAGRVWHEFTDTHREALHQLLFQGPVWDGNIISKAARDDLIHWDFAIRCCFLGKQGYTAATYSAFTVFEQGGGMPIKKKPGSPDDYVMENPLFNSGQADFQIIVLDEL